MRTQPPSRYVFKIEVLRGPPIRERDFKAPAEGDGFMLDDSDASGHDGMIALALAEGQHGPLVDGSQWCLCLTQPWPLMRSASSS